MAGLSVKCFICGNVGNMGIENDTPFSATVIKIGGHFGCICLDCLKRLYTQNRAFIKDDSENSSSIKEQMIKKMDEEQESDNEVVEETWKCLDYSLESFVKLINQNVFGQDEAAEKTAFVIYNNQFSNLIEHLGIFAPQRKSILLIGPTGVGKSLIAKTAAKALGVPYAASHADAITASGYVGDSVEAILERLYSSANSNLEKAENGIVIIDEIDKKAKRESRSDRDINGLAVQQELLKILEPNDVWIKHNTIKFNTSRLTIILCGAFIGLEDIVKKRLHPTTIGFSTDEQIKENMLNLVEPKDLVNYGFIEEFVGRAPVPIVLKPLSFSTIVEIIYEKLSQEEILFKSKNYDLIVDPLVINKIAVRVMEHNTGARDIKKEIDSLLYHAEYQLYNSAPGGICEIDEFGKTTIVYTDRTSKQTNIREFEGEEYLQEEY